VPERILIISDLHLGREHGAAPSAEALRPIWRGAHRLVLNGDIAEVHHPEHWTVAARETIRLMDLCEEDGVEVTILSGNHDPFLSDIRHLHLAGGRVFVTHGDVLHPAVAPWSPAAGRIRNAQADAMASLEASERMDLESRLSASQHACYAEWAEGRRLEREAKRSTFLGMFARPWALVQVLHYWRLFPKLAAAFAREHAPDARFTVIGHTHRGGRWRFGEHVVINTGSFGFPGRP